MVAKKTASPGMRLNIKTMRFGDLKKYKNNPRNNDEAIPKLANSLKEFDYQQPIVVTTDGEIIAGHTRLEAFKQNGAKDDDLIDVQVFKGTADQAKGQRLVDNKIPEQSGWDFEKQEMEIGDIQMDLEPFGIELFDEEEDAGAPVSAEPADTPVEDDGDPEEQPRTITCPHCGETIYLN